MWKDFIFIENSVIVDFAFFFVKDVMERSLGGGWEKVRKDGECTCMDMNGFLCGTHFYNFYGVMASNCLANGILRDYWLILYFMHSLD